MAVADQRVKGQESLVRVAVCQMEPRVGEKEKNVQKTLEMIAKACDQGAQLIVLPELCNSGYVFNSRTEAFELSEPVPDGPSCQAWMRAARERNAYITAGIAERVGTRLYNSSVLVGPDGYIGTFRKVHNWYEEKLFFEPGDLGFPVFQTRIGRIAMIICYDMWFPESWRICALKGADIVCVNTAWVPVPQGPGLWPMADYLCMGAAHCNAIFVAAADRIGVERGQPFLGHSIIVAPSGLPLAGPASGDKEEILLADCNLVDARRGKHWNELNGPLRDRRTDVYAHMLGYEEPAS